MSECSPPPNISRVMCHVSRVTCHVSHVTCHIFFFFFGQSGEAYRSRVCYQRGLVVVINAPELALQYIKT